MWKASIRTSREGTLVNAIDPLTFEWSTSLLGDGEATLTFKVDDAERPLPGSPEQLFFPNRNAVDLRWGNFVAFFGKIEKWTHDVDSATITVKAVELANEWKWRMTYGVGNYEEGTLDVNNRSLSGATARVLARWMQWNDGWRYPIDLPADTSGDFSDPGWEYWRKLRISDLIEQIREQGCEIYLRPYIADDGSTRLQTRVARRITINTSRFHLDAEDLPLGKIGYTVDGSRQLTGVQGLGNGSGRDQHVAFAGFLVGSDVPYRDARLDFPDLKGKALQDATTNALEESREPVAQWSVKEFTISDQWAPGNAAPARVWQLEIDRHPVLPTGTHMLRVIRASGSLGTTIRTEVQGAA